MSGDIFNITSKNKLYKVGPIYAESGTVTLQLRSRDDVGLGVTALNSIFRFRGETNPFINMVGN